MLACGVVLVSLVGGLEEGLRLFPRRVAATLDSGGVLLFLLLACLGVWWAGEAFFKNFIATQAEDRFTLLSGGTIPIANIGIGLKVASSLFLVFAVLAGLRVVIRRRNKRVGQP